MTFNSVPMQSIAYALDDPSEVEEVGDVKEQATVTFMAHGQKYDEQTLTVGQAVTRPVTDPAAEEGEHFVDWFLTDDNGDLASEAFDFTTSYLLGDITLTAKFEEDEEEQPQEPAAPVAEAEPEGEEAQGENEPETSEEPAADPESNAQQAETGQLRDLLTYIASDRVDGALSRIIDGEVVRVREDVQWRDEHMAWESVVADERYEAREEGREEGRAEWRAEGITEGREERNAKLLEFLRLRGAEAVIQALRAAGESED